MVLYAMDPGPKRLLARGLSEGFESAPRGDSSTFPESPFYRAGCRRLAILSARSSSESQRSSLDGHSRNGGVTDNCCLLNVRVLGFVVVVGLPSGRIGNGPGRVRAGPATA